MSFEFKSKPINLKTALAAVITSLVIGFIMVALFGYNPVEIYSQLAIGAVGSLKNIATSLRWSTPLLFTGTAAALAFRGGMFNFGIDGQLYVGSLAATIIGVTFSTLPGYILIPLMIIVSIIFGALWAIPPALIRVKLEGSEVVPALMMNYIGIYITDYIVHYYYLASGTNGDSLKTERIAKQAQFPLLVKGYQITAAFFIGLLIVFFFWWLVKKSKTGYEITICGMNPSFARYGGINVENRRILVMVLSGAIAGLGGAIEIMSMRWRYESGFAPNFGNDGILAALLGSSTPVGTFLGALFMGFLKNGSLAIERYTDVSRSLVTVIQGFIICFISAKYISQYIGLDILKKRIKGMRKTVKEVRHD